MTSASDMDLRASYPTHDVQISGFPAPLLVRASTYLAHPKLRQEEILNSDESCIGEEIPLLAEEGWTRHEENVPLPIGRGRGGQFGEIFRPEDFAKLLLRLRPIGLA